MKIRKEMSKKMIRFLTLKILILFSALALAQNPACTNREACNKACENSYSKCMARINDAEKCGFARLDCLNNCKI